ncbi:SkfA peptide export ATP-binding protein SkfE [Corynebacterium lowii]|uniref:SkfA peptide export ATP-binding protein SkfE n=1 Tax=Corynebacterium lowii TaxID=1544413 RepID=A0A0Q0U5X8_9CORY|nr:SkfA peptide export ATP-binding protein SkfE [Corynebacterium lowii]
MRPKFKENVTLNVNCTYGHGEPLGSLRYQFHPGTMYALTGPNGSGKSTLLATIAGELAPLDGEVLYDATPTSTGTTGVSLIAESVFFPDLTVGEHLDLLKLRRENIVEPWALSNILNAPLWALSSGQRQRAYLGMQLGAHAEVLLIDEPERHLDSDWTDFLIEHLRYLGEQGVCVLVATHSPRVMEGCDEVLRLGEE